MKKESRAFDQAVLAHRRIVSSTVPRRNSLIQSRATENDVTNLIISAKVLMAIGGEIGNEVALCEATEAWVASSRLSCSMRENI